MVDEDTHHQWIDTAVTVIVAVAVELPVALTIVVCINFNTIFVAVFFGFNLVNV